MSYGKWLTIGQTEWRHTIESRPSSRQTSSRLRVLAMNIRSSRSRPHSEVRTISKASAQESVQLGAPRQPGRRARHTRAYSRPLIADWTGKARLTSSTPNPESKIEDRRVDGEASVANASPRSSPVTTRYLLRVSGTESLNQRRQLSRAPLNSPPQTRARARRQRPKATARLSSASAPRRRPRSRPGPPDHLSAAAPRDRRSRPRARRRPPRPGHAAAQVSRTRRRARSRPVPSKPICGGSCATPGALARDCAPGR